jgi:hypothetical protein
LYYASPLLTTGMQGTAWVPDSADPYNQAWNKGDQGLTEVTADHPNELPGRDRVPFFSSASAPVADGGGSVWHDYARKSAREAKKCNETHFLCKSFDKANGER